MFKKQELIDILAPALVEQGHSLKDAQEALGTYSVPQLEKFVQKQENEQNVGLKTEVEIAIQTIENLQKSREELARLQAEREADWIEAEVQQGLATMEQRQSEQKRKEHQARELFPVVCRRHRLANIEANFRILFEADLLTSEFEADQAINSNLVTLVPESPQVIAEWETEDQAAAVEQYNRELLNADPVTLRLRARQEADQKRVQGQQHQAQANLEAQQQRESVMGFPKIPSDITRERIRAASPAELRSWSKGYGQYQLNKILAVQES